MQWWYMSWSCYLLPTFLVVLPFVRAFWPRTGWPIRCLRPLWQFIRTSLSIFFFFWIPTFLPTKSEFCPFL
jgi:hypothetical protein